MNARQVARSGVLIAIGVALHVVEAGLGLPLLLPGAKPGLANIVSLLGTMGLGPGAGLALNVSRVLLGSIFTGTLFGPAFLFSLAGAVASSLTMGLGAMLLGRRMSGVGMSVLGAAAHNTAQMAVAFFLTSHPGVFYYLPYLLLLAVPSGCLVGTLANRLMEHGVLEEGRARREPEASNRPGRLITVTPA